jgi:hypothetical protein
MLRMTLLVVVLLTATARASGQDLDELRKQKLEAASEAYKLQLMILRNGQGTYETLYRWSVRWMDAAREADPKADPVRHLQAHLDRLRELEVLAKAQFKGGLVTKAEMLAATYYRLDAQIQLELAKAKKKE